MTPGTAFDRVYDLPSEASQLPPDALWMIAVAATLLLDRYGVAGSVELAQGDGSRVPAPVIDEPDEYRLGELLAPRTGTGASALGLARGVLLTLESGGPDPVAITVSAAGDGAARQVRVQVARGRMSRSRIDAAAEHVRVILRAAMTQPTLRFGDLDIVTSDERQRLMVDWNAPTVHYPATTLHRMFVEQARRTPTAPAIIDGGATVTYEQLDVASNRVARQLRPYVTRPGQVIAVSGTRSAPILIAKVGVLKAGAAFLYIDPDTPAARAEQMCRIAAPVAVVCEPPARPIKYPAPRLMLADLVDDGSVPGDSIDDIADENTSAYVLFTSGSTGEPKGVVRPHRMHTTRIHLEQRRYALDSADRHLLKSVPFFREFFWALATGGAVVVARPGGERDDAYLIELIRRQRITVCSFVPSMLRVLVNNPRFGEPGLPIRHLFVAGEVFDLALERQLRELGVAVHVTYTMAEADYICHRGEPPATEDQRPTVGRPIDMRIYLCDAKLRLRPPGLVGEFYTGGPGLAHGYLNRPQLTAQRFLPNPFDPERVPVLFRTGDLGRFREDGQLEFLGRIDGQLKIRGYRVEPSEVEQVIRGYDGVDNAVVVGLGDSGARAHGQQHLLAAYVTSRDGQVCTEALRKFLLTRLPPYMIPHYIVAVADLPMLRSGKVDRANLQTRPCARPDVLGPAAPPEDELEATVLAVWRNVLGADEIGIDDPFTAIGGDSLRAMLLRVALERELACPVGMTALLERPTVRDFADYVRDFG